MSNIHESLIAGLGSVSRSLSPPLSSTYVESLFLRLNYSCLLLWQMMEEIFLYLSGTNSALPAMVQILADFASADG